MRARHAVTVEVARAAAWRLRLHVKLDDGYLMSRECVAIPELVVCQRRSGTTCQVSWTVHGSDRIFDRLDDAIEEVNWQRAAPFTLGEGAV